MGDRAVVAGLASSGKIAAYADGNSSGLDPLADVVNADAASGHQLSLRQRRFHRLDECRSQDFAGKRLDDLRTALHGFHHLTNRAYARHVRHLVAITESGG